jgi:ABC-type branched-subunit amino acid transport system ATPase component
VLGAKLLSGPAPAVECTPAEGEPLLTVNGVTVDIAGLRALDGVTLTVPKHGIIGVVGPNGAGKTSLLNAVCGYYPVTAGRIAFDGHPITNASTDTVSRIGIRRSFQHAPALAALTLIEYVALGYEAARPTGSALTALPVPAAGRADRDAIDRARDSLADLGLDRYAGRPMVDCPYAVRKLADVARAFLASPRLVLLDEPTSGVADDQRQRIAEVITAQAAATGASVLVVDHDVAFVTGLCTTLAAMASGRVLDAGPSTTVLSNRAVVEAFLGAAVPSADEMRSA